MSNMVLLGDEAVAVGAIHAGISTAYAYPGTPSTEIMEYLIAYAKRKGRPVASWSANEKTAYEEALGASLVGRRALTSMKHVGLNVAADSFINSALVTIHGGLVAAVADDPGMHSSQNEQDSRCLADFARVVCLEPANQQEAYEMTREAFDLSEEFHAPVMVRLVTRLAHSRAVVQVREAREENPLSKSPVAFTGWNLMPMNARRLWSQLLEMHEKMKAYAENSPYNALTLNDAQRELGIITTGIARNYYFENIDDLPDKPSHLHIGVYPFPVEKIKRLAAHVKKILVVEEGYPYLERYLRGIIPPAIEIGGKEDGSLPSTGELNPDLVRAALGLSARQGLEVKDFTLAKRPPQLCKGCPHADTYDYINKALEGYDVTLVTSDIGCYTLGALPPYSTIETCVCMGASVGMAKGAAEAGFKPVVAVIGDSTFLHSGVTPLMDAVAANANMTLVILDNDTVAMTGAQPTILPPSKMESLVKALMGNADHFHVVQAHRKHFAENLEIMKKELAYEGLSVIVSARECIETAKRKKKV